MFLLMTINTPQAPVQTSYEVHGLTLAMKVNGMTHTLEVSCTFTYLTYYPSTQPIKNPVSAAQADQGNL